MSCKGLDLEGKTSCLNLWDFGKQNISVFSQSWVFLDNGRSWSWGL